MHTVNTVSLGGVHSKEIIRSTKKFISRDFTMVLFKKRKGESVLRVKLDLILYIMHNINHQSLKNIHRNIYGDTKGQTGCEHKTSEI